ncbi:hypothetical protein CRUP_005336, partial [Coryphaenoides rupestris]
MLWLRAFVDDCSSSRLLFLPLLTPSASGEDLPLADSRSAASPGGLPALTRTTDAQLDDAAATAATLVSSPALPLDEPQRGGSGGCDWLGLSEGEGCCWESGDRSAASPGGLPALTRTTDAQLDDAAAHRRHPPLPLDEPQRGGSGGCDWLGLSEGEGCCWESGDRSVTSLSDSGWRRAFASASPPSLPTTQLLPLAM